MVPRVPYRAAIWPASPCCRAAGLVCWLSIGACAPAQYGSTRYGAGAPQPGITVPVRIAEGTPQPTTLAAPSASASAEPGPPPQGYAPDPQPLALATQWEYELYYDSGRVSVVRVRPRLFKQPVVTARRMGRYAIELWIGQELVDRVRFDFPAIAGAPAADAGPKPLEEPVSLAERATVSRQVLVPASPRATRAVLIDRATGKTQPLPWPPNSPLPPPPTSGARPVSGPEEGQTPGPDPKIRD